MAKSKSTLYSPKGKTPAARGGQVSKGQYGTFNNRNLMGVNPLKEQFEPTDKEPVRQRFKMGGGC